ncbi:MAG: hypothetical protein QM529_04280 [Hydrotalea sp.]|nr:hypothetical protein [Hydrotalea sp.]
MSPFDTVQSLKKLLQKTNKTFSTDLSSKLQKQISKGLASSLEKNLNKNLTAKLEKLAKKGPLDKKVVTQWEKELEQAQKKVAAKFEALIKNTKL